MFGKYFEYNGKSSQDFGIMTASFSMVSDDTFGMSRSPLRGEINRFRSNPNHMGTQWNDTLTFSIQLIKDICNDDQNMVFMEEEIDDINAWLTSPDYPLLFHMYDYDYVDENNQPLNKKYDYFGLFTDVSPVLINGEVIGFSCTFTTNSPFAWTQEKTQQIQCNGETEFIVTVDHSERWREVYPIIIINPDNEQEDDQNILIEIKQMTDNGKVMRLNLDKSETYIDTQKAMIFNRSGILSYDDLNIQDVDFLYWPKLYDGDNRFIISGDALVTFRWREARKVGAY